MACTISLGVALVAVFLTGCHWLNLTDKVVSKDRPSDLILDLGNKTKMRFVWVEPMELFVGKYEVSNKIFRRFKPKHNSGKHKNLNLNMNNQPVVNVSWKDAQDFCKWLNKNYGISGTKRYHFRLPTEQEWETYAACGRNIEFPWGNQWPPPEKWNYYGTENTEIGPKLKRNDGFRVSCSGIKSGKNAWRLFGVGGNVWEWCENTDGASQSRVYKGASWSDGHPYFLKISRRSSNRPDYRSINLGFRVVADISRISAEKQREFEALEKKKQAEDQAAQAKQKKETARQIQKKREQAERDQQAKKIVDQTLIQGLVADKKFNLAATQLAQYEKDYGQNAFSKKWSSALDNTMVLYLSNTVNIAFVRIKPLNIWMGKYEVSNKEFREFKPLHDSGLFKEWSLNEDDQPAVNVSWDDAAAFCRWLNTRLANQLEAGYECRLPTEAEWETAATCGQTREYPWGNQWPPKYGNYGLIEDYDDGVPVSCPVEESGQNEWGLYGMGGNVWEWCSDFYDSSQHYRVIRGGAWNLTQPESLRTANRTGDSEDRKNNYLGFRVVIGPKGIPPQ